MIVIIRMEDELYEGGDWDAEGGTLLDEQEECEEMSDPELDNIITGLYTLKRKIYKTFNDKVNELNGNVNYNFNKDLEKLYKYISEVLINNIQTIEKNDIINDEIISDINSNIENSKGKDKTSIDCFIKSIFVIYPYSLNKDSMGK
jgi:hypothetical protein